MLGHFPIHFEDGDSLKKLDERYHDSNEIGVRRYLATRFSSVLPTFDKGRNPIKVLRLLNRRQWLFFWVCFHFTNFSTS